MPPLNVHIAHPAHYKLHIASYSPLHSVHYTLHVLFVFVTNIKTSIQRTSPMASFVVWGYVNITCVFFVAFAERVLYGLAWHCMLLQLACNVRLDWLLDLLYRWTCIALHPDSTGWYCNIFNKLGIAPLGFVLSGLAGYCRYCRIWPADLLMGIKMRPIVLDLSSGQRTKRWWLWTYS